MRTDTKISSSELNMAHSFGSFDINFNEFLTERISRSINY